MNMKMMSGRISYDSLVLIPYPSQRQCESSFDELIGIYQTEEKAYDEKAFYDNMNLNYSHYVEERYI